MQELELLIGKLMSKYRIYRVQFLFDILLIISEKFEIYVLPSIECEMAIACNFSYVVLI